MAKSAVLKQNEGFLSTLPIGVIIAWHRDLDPAHKPFLPPGWVECNGQTLNDTESPFHRQLIPNLNADPAGANSPGLSRKEQMFLRGGALSGQGQDHQMQSHGHSEPGPGHSHQESGGMRTDFAGGGGVWGQDVPRWDMPEIRTRPTQVVVGNPTGALHGSETRPANMSVVWIMKIKHTISARATPSVLAADHAPLGAMYINKEGNIGVGTSNPQAKLDINGKIRGGGTVDGWSAERTGAILFSGSSPWTIIPGLGITFHLQGPALVLLTANGTQKATNGVIHVGYRYVVDNIPRGNPEHGQRLQVNSVSVSWWNTWTLVGSESLNPGNHSITVEARHSSSTGSGVICGEADGALQEYSGGTLNIMAIYK